MENTSATSVPSKIPKLQANISTLFYSKPLLFTDNSMGPWICIVSSKLSSNNGRYNTVSTSHKFIQSGVQYKNIEHFGRSQVNLS